MCVSDVVSSFKAEKCLTKYTSHKSRKDAEGREELCGTSRLCAFAVKCILFLPIVKNCWQLARVAQLENRWLIKARNALLRLTPPSVAEKQMKFLQEISFQ